MPENRFFFENSLAEQDLIPLEGNEFHHLVHVMRGKVDDRIEVVNGLGEMAEAKISQIGKKQAILQIQKVKHQPLPQFQVILAQAIPRLNRLDFIIEKGTELGMTKLLLFPSIHSERKKLTDDQLQRMRQVTIAAMKQCGRLDLPAIELKSSLVECKAFFEMEAYYGDVSPAAPLLMTEWQKAPPQKGVVFFIGPETGFSDEEIGILKELGAKGVRLHPNILRTDTAGLVALALIASLMEGRDEGTKRT
jgi:16S rRNA (uracil1498-N3)-methyltransferase